MRQLFRFSSDPDLSALATGFPSPFQRAPHPIAEQAAELLMQQLEQPWFEHDFFAPGGGRMLGVLVVVDQDGKPGFLAAFAGHLQDGWDVSGFVPPIAAVDSYVMLESEQTSTQASLEQELGLLQYEQNATSLKNEIAALEGEWQQALQALQQELQLNKQQRDAQRLQAGLLDDDDRASLLKRLSFESQRDRQQEKGLNREWHQRVHALKNELKALDKQVADIGRELFFLPQKSQQQLAREMTLINLQGESRRLSSLFSGEVVPEGAGECAASRLLYWAQRLGCRPLAVTEFWWGASPSDEVRHHRHFYPACRGRCRPILSFLLEGVTLTQNSPSLILPQSEDQPSLVYEDESVVLLNKPSGMLSVPGKEETDSVLERLRQWYPQATGPLLLHRLDLSTSGLILAAKNAKAHTLLQRQFEERTIQKRYLALLSRRFAEEEQKGVIDLPIRVDLNDRPRQLVCYQYGKKAVTRWERIALEGEQTRVAFYPVTGRTHQLRIHAAHQNGLAAPIVGDELYGLGGERLMLHAAALSFTHPVTGKRMEFENEAPF